MRQRIQVGDTAMINEPHDISQGYYGFLCHVLQYLGCKKFEVNGKVVKMPRFRVRVIGERDERDRPQRELELWKKDLTRLHAAPNYRQFLKKTRPDLFATKQPKQQAPRTLNNQQLYPVEMALNFLAQVMSPLGMRELFYGVNPQNNQIHLLWADNGQELELAEIDELLNVTHRTARNSERDILIRGREDKTRRTLEAMTTVASEIGISLNT